MSFERFESVAQSYVVRSPVVFDRAQASQVFDAMGNQYVDFCSGGYEHSNVAVRAALIEHLSNERVVQSCDGTTAIKRLFVEDYAAKILQPRNLRYRLLFTDPGSGMATEAALRLARGHKKRSKIVAFTHSSHGLKNGSPAVTNWSAAGQISRALRSDTTFMPFCGFFGEAVNTISYFRRYLEDSASGLERPAAVIVETVQVHGGVRIACTSWLEALGALCVEFDMLLIVDDSLTGCSATGPYFSFEGARLCPDMVVVSNAVAGGLPMSMLLLRPEFDVRRSDEQVAAVQGNGLAFVAARALLASCDVLPSRQAAVNSRVMAEELAKLAARYRGRLQVRGKGMLWGLDLGRPGSAAIVSAWALERGVIVEPARLRDDVLLIRPAVTIDETILREGLDRLDEAVSDFLSHAGRPTPPPHHGAQNSSIAHQSVTKPK